MKNRADTAHCFTEDETHRIYRAMENAKSLLRDIRHEEKARVYARLGDAMTTILITRQRGSVK